MQTKEQRLKAFTDMIGEDKYAALRECTNNNILIIDPWLEGKRTYLLKTENLPDNEADDQEKAQAEVEGLLLCLVENAIYRHDKYKTNKDHTLHLLIGINDKTPFVRDNDIELVSEALKTKNHWCIYQVLHLSVDLKTPVTRVVDVNSSAHRTDIFKAYMLKRPDLVRAKLDAGGDPNQVNEQGETLLQLARREGKQEWINLLVSYYPPMFYAYELKDFTIIEMLVRYKFGEHLGLKGPDGLTLTELAQRDKREDVLELLSTGLEDFNARDEKSRDIKLKEVVDYTTNHCLEVIDGNSFSDLEEDSCYYYLAIEYWYSGKDKRSVEEFLNGLLEYAKITQDYKNYLYLYESLLKRPEGKSKEELEKSSEAKEQEVAVLGKDLADLFEKFSDADSFYDEFSATNVEFYIFTNSWLNGVDYKNISFTKNNYSVTDMLNSLLLMVIINNDEKAFQILIDAHKKQNFINIKNETLLKAIIYSKNIKFVAELLDLGFDPNGDMKNLPLYGACKSGDLDIVKLLIKKGADPHLLNANGNSFSLISIMGGYQKEIVDYINQYFEEHPTLKSGSQAQLEKESEGSKPKLSTKNQVVKTDTSVTTQPQAQVTALEESEVKIQKIRRERLDQLKDYMYTCRGFFYTQNEMSKLKGFSEYNRVAIEDWFDGKNTLSAEEMLNKLYLHARKIKDQETHKYLGYALMERIRRDNNKEITIAKTKRLAIVKNWFSEDLFRQLKACSDFNNIVIDHWLNITDKDLGSYEFSVNHLLDLLLHAAEYYEDTKTIELLKKDAPYTQNFLDFKYFKDHLEKTRKAIVKKYPEIVKKIRDARLKEMQDLGVTEEDLLRLAAANANYIGELFNDWLIGEGYLAKVSANELFLNQLISVLEPPHYEGGMLLFNFIMSKKLYPSDKKNQASLVYRAVCYGVEKNLKIFLEAGFPTNRELSCGPPALYMAYEKCSPSMVKHLLDYQADPTKEYTEGKTVLDLAREDKSTTMIKLLDPDYVEEASKNSNETEKNKDSDASSKSESEQSSLEQCMLDIFQVKEGIPSYEQIRDQWTARGKSTVNDDDMNAMPDFMNNKISSDDFEFQLKVEKLDADVLAGLQNMIAYATKLYREHENCKAGSKKTHLASKVDIISDFLRRVLSEEGLSAESIQKAYTTLEKKDINRGTGFYRFHSLYAGKWYEDKKGQRKLVKSTMGELAHDFYEAVKKHSAAAEKN